MDALIVIALVAAMAEDAFEAAGASWGLRQALGLACTAFDALFTLEFAARLARAASENRLGPYLGRELGWVDALASLPLLILVSGPFLFAALDGGLSAAASGLGAGSLATAGFLGPMRALRSLRLIRFVRILSRIKGYGSVATRRHVAKAASLGMGAIVAAFLLMELAAAAGIFPEAAGSRARSFSSLCATLAALAVAGSIVLIYGPFFARGVGAPLLASIRWASGEDTRVRAFAPLGRADEEPFVLADLLDDRALLEASATRAVPRRESASRAPASREEIEGLLARASALADDPDRGSGPRRHALG
jgi:hypothetical protein